MSHLLIILLLALIMFGFALLFITRTIHFVPHISVVDERTIELCKWYASRDHEKEFSVERWKQLSAFLKSYDWFDSCINHVKHPVS